MPTNVLITGAAGYIGSMLIESLSATEAIGKIVGIDLRDSSAAYQGNHKIKLIQADISQDSWKEAIGGEHVGVAPVRPDRRRVEVAPF
jgi:nucleoside-diphosphate-sugar epimerase